MCFMNKKFIKISKYFSFVLWYNFGFIGFIFDEVGWVDVGELIEKVLIFFN